MDTDGESHEIIVSRGRRALLVLPRDMTADEWKRMLEWLAFTRPTIVDATHAPAAPAVTEADDLRRLLAHYVNHVRDCEGIDFIDRDGYDEPWTTEDRAALAAALAAAGKATG